MKKQICKIWSVILAAILCMALFQVSALAADYNTDVSKVIIPVTVTTSGSNIPSETYTFKLTAQDGAPMPNAVQQGETVSDEVTVSQDADGNSYATLSITGSGAGSVTAYFLINYRDYTVGEYHYTLTQEAASPSSSRGHYDTTVYNITITIVNAETGGYAWVIAVYKSTGGEKCDTEFVNTYDRILYSSLLVEKTANVADDYKAELGDTISYEIKVTNNGDKTISDITVTDDLTGETWTIDTLAPNASQTFETSYVVTEADILAGSVKNVATASGVDPSGTPVEDEDEETVPTVDPNGHLTVTKTATSTPANGAAYALGETITYQITVTNDGNLTITDIKVTDELTGNTGTEVWTIDSLAPGESKTFTASYLVTEADILAGTVLNVATASGTSPDPDQPDVPVVPGEDEEPTVTPQPSIYVEKTALVEDGYVAAAGDTINYEIKVINNGNVTISGITVSDSLTGESWTIESLEPNASQTFTTSYVVTESDVIAGSVVNTATAGGTDPDGNPTEGTDQEEVPTEDPNSHLTVTKTTTSTPADGTAYQPGEKITYQITVTNDGNLTITNITVTDELTGNTGENAWTIDSLAPGESKTFTAEYTVTEADAAAGSVVNNATASGTSPDPSQDGPTVVPGTSTDPTAPLPETETESESESETETETETEAETESETESETTAESESESETTAATTSPQTGDNTPITLYAALMLLAAAVVTGLTVYRKKTE